MRVEFWVHTKCRTKIQFTGPGAYCPLCRHGVSHATIVSFENPDINVIPNREHLEAPQQRLRDHSRYSGSVDGIER